MKTVLLLLLLQATVLAPDEPVSTVATPALAVGWPLDDATRVLGGALQDSLLEPAPPGNVPDKPAHVYRYSEAVSVSVRNEIAYQFTRNSLLDPTAKVQVQQNFENTDLVSKLQPVFADMGYPVHSVATALSAWLLVNYGIIHDTPTTDVQNAAVYRQISTLLARLPMMTEMEDAEKQRIAEGLYWIATLQQYAYEQAQAGIPGYSLSVIASDARHTLHNFGLDADALHLDDTGFSLQK